MADGKFKTADEVVDVLAKAYPSPAFAFLRQVRNGTGYTRRTRTADAVAMSLWPSRGLLLSGFEVKVSRYDWQSELKEPRKAEEIQRFCHQWWLVTGNDDVAEMVEIPATWGWLSVDGDRLKTMKDAPLVEPTPIDLTFLAAVLRNVATRVDDRDIESAYRRGVDAGKRQVSADELESALQKLAFKAEKIKRQVEDALAVGNRSWWKGRLKPCIGQCGAWVSGDWNDVGGLCPQCAESLHALREKKSAAKSEKVTTPVAEHREEKKGGWDT